jgi:hypothetical protein
MNKYARGAKSYKRRPQSLRLSLPRLTGIRPPPALLKMPGRSFGFGAAGKLERARFKVRYQREQCELSARRYPLLYWRAESSRKFCLFLLWVFTYTASNDHDPGDHSSGDICRGWIDLTSDRGAGALANPTCHRPAVSDVHRFRFCVAD